MSSNQKRFIIPLTGGFVRLFVFGLSIGKIKGLFFQMRKYPMDLYNSLATMSLKESELIDLERDHT